MKPNLVNTTQPEYVFCGQYHVDNGFGPAVLDNTEQIVHPACVLPDGHDGDHQHVSESLGSITWPHPESG